MSIQIINTSTSIEIAQINYPKNSLLFEYKGETITIMYLTGDQIIEAHYLDFVDSSNENYASVADVISDLKNSYTTQSSGGGGTGNEIMKDGSVVFTQNQSMGGKKLTSLGNGTLSGDAINKGQLDSSIQQITYTNLTLAQAQAKQAGTGSPAATWTEGFYRVETDIGATGYFYSKTIKKDGVVKLDEFGSFEITTTIVINGNPWINGKGHFNLLVGIIDEFEYIGKDYTGITNLTQKIKTTNGLDAFFIGDQAAVWGNTNYDKFEAINPTITPSGGDPTTNGVSNTINSVNDIFIFTKEGQRVVGLNEGNGRIISFAAIINLIYTNCIIQSGKTIIINSSQSGKYWVDTRSTFTEILDIDVAYNGGTALLDLVTVQHAGLIIFNSPTTASPTIKGFINWLYDGMTRTFQIDGTTNPAFEASPLKFPLVTLLTPPLTLTTVNDLAVISFLNTEYFVMADSNTY